MGKKKKKSAKPGGLKAILAETEAKRAAKAGRRRMSSSSGESVESDDPSAIELMERAATKTTDSQKIKLDKKLDKVQGRNKCCFCLSQRHCVGCVVISLTLVVVAAIVIIVKWDDVESIWDDA